jgi:hypothetical protein
VYRCTTEIALRTGLRAEFIAGLRVVRGQSMRVSYLACTAVATFAVAAQRAVYVLDVDRSRPQQPGIEDTLEASGILRNRSTAIGIPPHVDE